MITAMKYAGGKRARIRVQDVDRYGRLVAVVSLGESNLGRLLVRDGYAWHYEDYAPNATQLARLEKEARKAGRGLWSQSSPIPPWEWRAAQGNQVGSTSHESTLPSDSDGLDRDRSEYASHN